MKYFLLALTIAISYPINATAQSSTNYAVGNRSICSLSDAGIVSCGTGSAFTRLQPPADLPALTSIVAGDVHVCGLTEAGEAICWGDNNFGQTDVPAGEQFISISAGINLTCGVTTDNRALCWGLDSHGEAEPPADVLFSQIANDLTTSCGLTLDNTVACWGQFDLASHFDNSDFFTKLAINDETACALTDQGEIRCRFQSQTPVGVDMLDVAMTRYLICGLQASGDMVCTSNNGTPSWLTHLADRLADINSGPNVLSLHGGLGETKMCYTTADGGFDCIVRENNRSPEFPGMEPDSLSAPVVSADLYSDTTVELSWVQSNATTGGADIYRDGELLTFTANGGSYIDDTMIPGETYEYSVATYSATGGLSPTSNPISVAAASDGGDSGTGTGYSPAPRPLEPADLSFRRYSPNAVELFWSRPESLNSNFYGYEIRRNHEFHAFTRGVSFYDTVIPGENYHYDVVAVSRDGTILGFSGIDTE